MNSLIQQYPAVADVDLILCEAHGVAYQADMKAGCVPYDDSYFDKYKSYEDTPIASALNAGRCALLMRHAADGATVLDIGAGCGTFVRQARSWGFGAKGFDIIAKTVEYLRSIDAYADDPAQFDVVTFWDSLEHIENPEELLSRVRHGAHLLVAIPLFPDLSNIRESKHYRPGEHFYYFTAAGFIDWMALNGFRLLEVSDHETSAGRESIGAFAFCKDFPK